MMLNDKLTLIAVPLLVACGGTDGMSVRFTADSASGTPNALTVMNSIDVTRLQLQLREVKILPDDNMDGDKFMAKGTFTFDLLDATKSTIPDVVLDAGTYKKVEFKIDKPDNGGGIDGTNTSLWFEGTKDSVKFRYLAEKHDKITLRDVDGAQYGSQDLVVDLRVSEWLTRVDMARLTKDASDVAILDASGANKDAYKTVSDNIKASIKLLRKPR